MVVGSGRKRATWTACAVWTFAASLAGDVRADSPATAVMPVLQATRAPTSGVFVAIHRVHEGKRPPLVVDLYRQLEPAELDRPFFSCTTPCTLRVPPGTYGLVVRGTWRTFEQGAVVTILEPSTLYVDPDERSLRYFGVILAAAGMALVGAGIARMGKGDWCDETADGCVNNSQPGLRLAGLGLILAPAGFLMFGQSFGLEMSVVPFSRFPNAARNAMPVPTFGVRFAF